MVVTRLLARGAFILHCRVLYPVRTSVAELGELLHDGLCGWVNIGVQCPVSGKKVVSKFLRLRQYSENRICTDYKVETTVAWVLFLLRIA